MATTFDSSLPTRRDEARLLLGDTGADATPFLLDDETLDAKLARYPFHEAVAQLADGLAVRFAQEPDALDDEGGVRVRWSDRIGAWERLARRLRSGESRTEPAVVGGQFVAGRISAPDPTPIRSAPGPVPGLRF